MGRVQAEGVLCSGTLREVKIKGVYVKLARMRKRWAVMVAKYCVRV